MRDAARLAQACNNYNTSSQTFYMASVLLAEVGLESALEYLRRIHPAPTMPEWEETGDLEQMALAIPTHCGPVV